MRAVLVLLVWLSIGVLCLGSSPATDDWGSKLGVAERIEDLVCVSTPGKVQAGDLVQLVGVFDEKAFVAAVVEEVDSNDCWESSRAALQGPFHRLRLDRSITTFQSPAIAVLGGRIPLIVEGGSTGVDLDGDGVAENFRSCTSGEGIHLTVWSGEPLKGTRRWHQYFYLGYDTEPSCTERDY